MFYRVVFGGANLKKMSLVMAAAMLAICLLALVETTEVAEAEDSLPENGKIAYSDGASIYVVNSDGTGRTYVAPDDASTSTYVTPAWSPDGTKIAFSGNMRICVMDADGSHLRCLTDNSTDDTSPAWSSDGTKIAYTGYGEPGHGFEIYTVNADGSDQTRLTNNRERDEDINSDGELTRWRENLDPAWSPDGKKIAFGVDATHGRSGIYVMKPDGSNQTLVIAGGDQPDWSPDGSKIAYRREYPGQRNTDISVANADGSNPVNLTGSIGDGSGEHVPAWSPDGTKIVFRRDQNEKGRIGIYAIDADGRNLRRLTNIPVTDASPDWQPLPGTTPPKDADGSDETQVTKKPGVEDVDRDRPEPTVIVKPGDSLWSISEERLGPEASPQRVYDHTYQMYALNRKRIGSDPDLIFVGQRLSLPPLGEG